MIQTIKDKSLKLLFEKGDVSKIRLDLLRKVENILARLDAANELRDMNGPGLDLHELKGDRKGTWTVMVKNNWRITFNMENGKVFDVTLEDSH